MRWTYAHLTVSHDVSITGAERGAPDGRTTRTQSPVHALTAEKRERILAIANSVEFEQMPPSQRALMVTNAKGKACG